MLDHPTRRAMYWLLSEFAALGTVESLPRENPSEPFSHGLQVWRLIPTDLRHDSGYLMCNIDPSKQTGEVFAPVSIKRFIGGSNEVLFPPQTKFRVKEEKDVQRVTENDETRDVHTRVLEVVELPVP
ncbi:unnamed protein product, partial [Symbiodinium necroappetens]